jgi:hypothetical protein
MTAASKSIPPHTLAWIYSSASNETIVYVNPTDRVLDAGDRGLLEIHLPGMVSVAESDFVDQREGAVVAISLEKLEEALKSASALDETVRTKDNVHASIEASESTLGTAGVGAILADDGQFGQTRTGLGASMRFRTSSDDSADATKKSDGASAVSANISSIELARSATATAVENVTLKSGPINEDTGVSSTRLNENVQPSAATLGSAGHGNSHHDSESRAAVAESTDADSKSGNRVGNGAEHHAAASDAPRGSAKKAESSGVEHGNSGHSYSADAPDAGENVESNAATAESAARGNSQHASKSGSAPGNGVDKGAEHHAPASDAARGSAKTAEPGGAEHGISGHSDAANVSDAAEIGPGVVATASASHGNSQHTSEPGSAKAAATELIEIGVNGVGSSAEHHAPASDAARGSAETAEPGGAEHGKSGQSTAANAPDAAEIDPGVATSASAGHGNSQHASEPGSAKTAATESIEAGSKPGSGAEHHAPASDATRASAALNTAELAAVEHGNSGHSANTPEAAEIIDPSAASGGNAEPGNSHPAAQSAAVASEDAQPAKAAFETGGADQGPVFRFDGGPTPSTLVAVVELKELNEPLDWHVPPGQRENLEMIVKTGPNPADEHAATHGNSDPHHPIVPAPHDFLI